MQLLQIPILSELTAAANGTPTIPADSVDRVSVIDIVNMASTMDRDDIRTLFQSLGVDILHFFANLFIAIVVYYVGKWLLKKVIKLVDIAFEKREVEFSVRSFGRSFIKSVFYVLLFIMIVQILGVNTASLVAMLASAGLAIGMALSGTLQNFAGGVMILFLKPYRVGDYITSQGESGIVKEIMLFTTVLETYDRHTIFVPNSTISSSIIDNASFADTRRIDWQVAIAYGDSVAKAREVILDILSQDDRIFKEGVDGKAPTVGITGLGDSAVNLVVRGWVSTIDYWDVYYNIYDKLYEQLPERGLNFPFPQMDVHIKS